MAYEHKIITIKKVAIQVLPKKMYASDKVQEFVTMYFLLDNEGNRYQYIGNPVSDSKVSETEEMLVLAEPGDKVKIMYVQVKSGALDLKRVNKILEISENKE
jgi:hypothetical protein